MFYVNEISTRTKLIAAAVAVIVIFCAASAVRYVTVVLPEKQALEVENAQDIEKGDIGTVASDSRDIVAELIARPWSTDNNAHSFVFTVDSVSIDKGEFVDYSISNVTTPDALGLSVVASAESAAVEYVFYMTVDGRSDIGTYRPASETSSAQICCAALGGTLIPSQSSTLTLKGFEDIDSIEGASSEAAKAAVVSLVESKYLTATEATFNGQSTIETQSGRVLVRIALTCPTGVRDITLLFIPGSAGCLAADGVVTDFYDSSFQKKN